VRNPTPTCRWLRISLRTLFVVVTVFSGWLAKRHIAALLATSTFILRHQVFRSIVAGWAMKIS
jgi:hypothetical protein